MVSTSRAVRSWSDNESRSATEYPASTSGSGRRREPLPSRTPPEPHRNLVPESQHHGRRPTSTPDVVPGSTIVHQRAGCPRARCVYLDGVTVGSWNPRRALQARHTAACGREKTVTPSPRSVGVLERLRRVENPPSCLGEEVFRLATAAAEHHACGRSQQPRPSISSQMRAVSPVVPCRSRRVSVRRVSTPTLPQADLVLVITS